MASEQILTRNRIPILPFYHKSKQSLDILLNESESRNDPEDTDHHPHQASATVAATTSIIRSSNRSKGSSNRTVGVLRTFRLLWPTFLDNLKNEASMLIIQKVRFLGSKFCQNFGTGIILPEFRDRNNLPGFRDRNNFARLLRPK